MEALLKLPEVIKRTSLCRSLIYQMMKGGEFPKNIPIYGRSVGWVESEIENWIQNRIKNARTNQKDF